LRGKIEEPCTIKENSKNEAELNNLLKEDRSSEITPSNKIRILRSKVNNVIWLQCKSCMYFKELNLDRKLNYFHNGKICKGKECFGIGDHVIRFSGKLFGAVGIMIRHMMMTQVNMIMNMKKMKKNPLKLQEKN
jgi:hypothetical protein